MVFDMHDWFFSNEALQDNVYILLPPVFNVGLSLKRPETTHVGYFWSPLDSKSQDFTKDEPGTSHITQRILHKNFKF